jgi:hypothetical protein
MTFKFNFDVDYVGGFLNYAPGYGTPVMAIYDAGHNLLESYTLSFNTVHGPTVGFFYGFYDPNGIIYFTLTGAYLGITDLATAPLPSTLLLVGPALLGLAWLRRRMNH